MEPQMNFPFTAKFTRFLLGSIATLGWSISGHNPALSRSISQPQSLANSATAIVTPVKSTLIAKETSIDDISDSKIIEYSFPQVKVATIELLPGMGTNISFDSVNQTIQTMFLDNQSHISMSTNACLASEGRCADKSMQVPTLIHISLIDDLELPGVIQTNKKAAHNSLLTVITTDAQKNKQTYLFALKLFQKNSSRKHVALVRIVPTVAKVAVAPVQPEVKPQPPEVVSRAAFMNASAQPFIPPNLRTTDRRKIAYLTDGFRLAVNRGDYKFNFGEYRSINGFIKALGTAEATLDSAPFYAVRLDVIDHLIILGTPVAPRDVATEAVPTAPAVPPASQPLISNRQEI
jgi:hypothetical protein